MQAIQTKYIPATNTRGSRIKAACEAGSLTISYPYELNTEQAHIKAANMLCEKLQAEYDKRYPSRQPERPVWLAPKVCGGLPDGTYAHVFI